MEKETNRRPAAWQLSVADTPHELEELVAFDMLDRLALATCSARVDELAKWLAPKLGRQATEVMLAGDLFNLLTAVADIGLDVGIAVERCRVLAESGPRSKPGDGPDCERWLALAMAESGLKPLEVESLIPKAEK